VELGTLKIDVPFFAFKLCRRLIFAVLWAYNKGVNNEKKKEISDDNDKND
jgi:hypothetical protein